MFDCIFPAHGFFFGGVAFVVDKSYRTFGFGVFGSVFAAVVGFQALFQTVCPSGVKSTVGTLDDCRCNSWGSFLGCKVKVLNVLL